LKKNIPAIANVTTGGYTSIDNPSINKDFASILKFTASNLSFLKEALLMKA
jgi:hypothetical protein